MAQTEGIARVASKPKFVGPIFGGAYFGCSGNGADDWDDPLILSCRRCGFRWRSFIAAVGNGTIS